MQQTPLYLAAENNHIHIIEFLLDPNRYVKLQLHTGTIGFFLVIESNIPVMVNWFSLSYFLTEKVAEFN